MDQAKVEAIGVAVRRAFDSIEDKTSPIPKQHTLWTHNESAIGKLVIEFCNGQYHVDGATVNIHHVMVAYLSLETIADGPEEGWFVNQPQYFHPTQLDDAINVFLSRVNSPCMYRACGNDDNSIQAVHALELKLQAENK